MLDPYGENAKYFVHRFANREEWKSYRIRGIGASEASACLGVNPYLTNTELWEIKVNGKNGEIKSNAAMEYGINAEKPLRELFELVYSEMYDVHYLDNCILQSKEYPFMLFSPDGLLYDKKNDRYGIYEGKTTSILQSMHKEKWNNQVPQNYFIQCLHALAVSGFDFAILNAELRYTKTNENGEEEFEFVRKIYMIEREEHLEDIEYLIVEEKEFWNSVEKKERPPLLVGF